MGLVSGLRFQVSSSGEYSKDLLNAKDAEERKEYVLECAGRAKRRRRFGCPTNFRIL
jgi:hypothetical protein